MTAPADAAGGGTEPLPARRALAVVGRLVASRPVRWGFVLAAVGLACYAVVADWAQIRGALGELGFWPLAAAMAAPGAYYAGGSVSL